MVDQLWRGQGFPVHLARSQLSRGYVGLYIDYTRLCGGIWGYIGAVKGYRSSMALHILATAPTP